MNMAQPVMTLLPKRLACFHYNEAGRGESDSRMRD